MTDCTWRPGDKVRLTGRGWDGSAELMGLKVGDIATIGSRVGQSHWTLVEPEGDHGPLYAWADPDDLFGAERIEEPSASGEVRTTSSTGGEKGVKPEAYALIPWEAMDEVARVYNAGAQKYAAHNWRKGYEWSKSFSAACRHFFAFWRGEDRDPELGTLHLAMAVFHLLGLITFSLDREKYGQFDDRYKKED